LEGNRYPVALLWGDSLMGVQLMEIGYQNGIEKFVSIGTICSYPKYTPIPFKEEDLWSDYPEEANVTYEN